MRIVERVTHTGLGAEVNEAVEGLGGEGSIERPHVRKVEFDEFEPVAAEIPQTLRPPLFQLDRIIIVEIVDADDGVTARKQILYQRHADKSGDAGDEDGRAVALVRAHRSCPFPFASPPDGDRAAPITLVARLNKVLPRSQAIEAACGKPFGCAKRGGV